MTSIDKQINNAPASPSILIADDVPKNIQLVAKFLMHEGYNLFYAQSGEAALKQIRTRAFDLILLDVMMPGTDGFEVCSEIKKNEETQNIPVIFLTAKSDEASIQKGFSLGGVDYITKPFDSSELLARVRTHLNLRLRETELQELNETKDMLLSIIGHDLKTPFFNIMNLCELLLNNYDTYSDDFKKELILNVVNSSRASHILLENLLNWTHIQTGKIFYNPDDYDLEEIVKSVLGFLSSQAKNKEVACTYNASKEITVFTDINMLQTILRNLVSNAVKFTPRGGTVEIDAEKINDTVYIKVIDNGIGISPDRMKEIFSLKKLRSAPGTENEPGTGFGLILSRKLVELNKGILEAESTEGKGTTFRFSLPAGK